MSTSSLAVNSNTKGDAQGHEAEIAKHQSSGVGLPAAGSPQPRNEDECHQPKGLNLNEVCGEKCSVTEAGPRGGLAQETEKFRRNLIAETLMAERGNKCRAAKALGVHRNTISRLLDAYQLPRDHRYWRKA